MCISIEEFKKIQEHVVIIDVREPVEVALFSLPNSRFHPMSHFQIPQDLSKDAMIVTVCAHGVRSYKALEILKAHGFTNVYSLTGGLAAYRAFL